MKSGRGVLAVLVLVLSIPLTALLSTLTGADDEVLIHFFLGTGFVVFALAVFDFQTPAWVRWAGCLSMVLLASIFYAQGLERAFPSERFHEVAFDILGQEIESGLLNVFVFWCAVVLLLESRDRNRLFGIAGISLVAVSETFRYGLLVAGEDAVDLLKLLFILPVIWFAIESRKEQPATRRLTTTAA